MRRAALLVAVVLAIVIESDLKGLANLSGLSSARAQSGGSPSALLPSTRLGAGSTGYDLTWWTMDSGGDMFSTGGSYSLGVTIGQPDASAWSGGGYALVGGFWGGSVSNALGLHRTYLPLVLR
jgi:hypothetical protein